MWAIKSLPGDIAKIVTVIIVTRHLEFFNVLYLGCHEQTPATAEHASLPPFNDKVVWPHMTSVLDYTGMVENASSHGNGQHMILVHTAHQERNIHQPHHWSLGASGKHKVMFWLINFYFYSHNDGLRMANTRNNLKLHKKVNKTRCNTSQLVFEIYA